MRISVGFVIGSFRRGGAERDLLELVRRLDRRRYDLHVLYAEHDGDMLQDFERAGVPMYQLRISSLTSWSGLRAVGRARRYLIENGARIVHGFGFYGAFYAAVMTARLPGVSLVSYEFTAMRPRGLRVRFFQPYYYHRSAAIVGNSDAVLKVIARHWSARGRRLLKIHNGIDPEIYAAARAQEGPAIPGVPSGAPIVGSVGRLHPIKGHKYLVAGWPRVAARFPEARLVLVGPAWRHQQAEIEETARRSGCADRLVLLGLRHDVPQLLRRMDVVVVPSLMEGFSNAVLEAGAAGRPVVATRVGGNPEAIVEGETGLIVPPRDPEALATAIADLLSDPGRRAAMGEAARHRVTSLYTVDRMIDAYDQLYTSLVDREAGRRAAPGAAP